MLVSEPRDMLGPMSPSLELSPSTLGDAVRRDRPSFAFVAERLWLDFVNTDTGVRGADALHDFDRFVLWLEAAHVLDAERSASMRRRSQQQPAGALAVLGDARRVRTVLRALAERGVLAEVRLVALGEINRVLGRSAAWSIVPTAPSRGRSCRWATRSPACSSPWWRARRTRSSSISWGACAAAPIRGAAGCSRTRRRTGGGAGATWRRAATARRRRGTA